MDLFEWSDDLSIGVGLIDQQHKMLIKRVNDVAQALKDSEAEARIVRTLDFLVDYTQFHFSEEEKYMKLYDYPGLTAHQKNHAELIDTLHELDQDFREEGATHILAEALNTFLHNWLIKHIMGVDVRFGEFLDQKGIELQEDE